MKDERNKTDKKGSALLVVLFVVMVVTILSLGFLSRSDVELACGENMILRAQMDYLAESGLEHARGLIINDSNFSGAWSAGGQQLAAGSDDYYDIDVALLTSIDPCDPNQTLSYEIICTAYREKYSERFGESILKAELCVEPNVAYWASYRRIND